MSVDPAIRDHQAWLGYLQPDGLVVSPAALVDAQALVDRNALPLQERFLEQVEETETPEGETLSVIADVPSFLREFLEWPDDCLYGLDPARTIPESLQIPLPELGTDLAPTFAFRDPKPKDAAAPWLLLGLTLSAGADMDRCEAGSDSQWSASQHQRFERLLRDAKVPIGLLFNGTSIRLVYAPHGENSGSISFPVQAMTEVAGRPILSAFDLLLNGYRLLAAPTDARLPALLRKSREYQSTVSTLLAQQVLDSLYELLRGFQAADERTRGELLREVLAQHPDQVYSGLLTVMLRLVFLLYAEDRGLMPGSDLYLRNYSIHGLFERLRADHEHYPDTMDQRYGAWAQLLALFRVVFNGCRHPQMAMPPRSGHLFDPTRFPFLEGAINHQPSTIPLVPDGVIFRVLSKLLFLDGERLSYRTLDVEEIGSVYQTIMGFRLEVAAGQTIALTGKRKHKSEVPAPLAINLDDLLATKAADRAKWLKEQTDHDVPGSIADDLKKADSIDELLAALDRRIARDATPRPVPKGGMILQPTDERRRSGSHYTPRTLTQPIVRKTLEPILKRMGDKPTPEQILALKICDPAMGSAAFLVETCRQLADELVKAWHVHGKTPTIPPDEDEVLLARRIVAQRCLYGVDRNPMAVDLAKLSLWLVTLAKDHPFTFIDHAFKCGDSLVGLTKAQIAAFHWNPKAAETRYLGEGEMERKIQRVSAARVEILNMAEDNIASILLKRQKLTLADEAADPIRHAADLAIAAFFGTEKDKGRQRLRDEYLDRLTGLQKNTADLVWMVQTLRALRSGVHPVTPFHWEIEYPEVFDRENRGFDGIVGNPPFLGGTRISEVSGMPYFQWLVENYPPAGHLCDLVAYFFRRLFSLLRHSGTLGLLATNTVAQGDTREGGLGVIVKQDGCIYEATRRYRWPGQAAVVVSIVHIAKCEPIEPSVLDGKNVSRISAFLFPGQVDDSPIKLSQNPYFSLGSKIYGQGFLFCDDDPECTSLSVMQDILTRNPKYAERIRPYIGGEEFNGHPEQRPHRHAIYLSDIKSESELDDWPELKTIVLAKVKPERDVLGSNPNNIPLKRRWWAYQAHRPELYDQLTDHSRVLVNSAVSGNLAFGFLPAGWIYSHATNVFCVDSFAGFCSLQARVHEVWARFLASSMKDDLRYTASDCFETFPFPLSFETNRTLEQVGREYYEFRAALMVRNNEGLTKTYNRFHDPEETSPDIIRLRELHAAMDRAVLDAYGWTDIQPTCEFILDYEDDPASSEDYAEASDGKGRRRKKPWRYRWPDPIRDDVLARLLALNAQRAEEERLAGEGAAEKRQTAKSGRTPKAPRTKREQPELEL